MEETVIKKIETDIRSKCFSAISVALLEKEKNGKVVRGERE